MPVSVDRTGLGGGARIQLSCDGCTSHNLIFDTSTLVQYFASLSVALAFLLTGHVHSGCQGLSIPFLHRNTFYYTVVKDAYANIQRMLQEICEHEKAEMKKSAWQNAVTTADWCWLTRGHFSQNCTSIVKNLPEEHHSVVWPPLHAWKRQRGRGSTIS